MEFRLTSQDIYSNYQRIYGLIKTEFPAERTSKLLKMYDDLEERITMSPASSFDHFHNAFPGGYCDHVLRVYDFALMTYELWKHVGFQFNFTLEELKFAALHHDLYKVGFPGQDRDHYVPSLEKWEIQRGQLYKVNPNEQVYTGSDKTLLIFNLYNIAITENEFLGIRLADGLYEEGNDVYYTGFQLEKKLRTSLPYILHQADIMAFRFEFERWAKFTNKFNTSKMIEKPAKSKATIEHSDNAMDAFKKLFGDNV